MLMSMRSPLVTAALLVATLAVGGTDPPSPAPVGGGDIFGSTRCDNAPSATCTVYAGTPEGAPAAPESPVVPAAPRKPSGGGGEPVIATPVSCSYVRSEYQPLNGGVVLAAWHRPLFTGGVAAVALAALPPAPTAGSGPGLGPGAWYDWQCRGSGARDGLFRPPIWIADRPARPGNGPSAAQLAQLAQRQLRPVSPVIVASPVGEQLVNVPTWLWVAGQWAPVTATAAVPGVSVTARATPVSVVWRMGDGAQVMCRGPGTPFPTGADPAAGSPDCGYTYRHSSAAAAGQMFPVTATVTWMVTWAGAGQTGVFPGLTTTGAAGFHVAESQAVNGTD